jgi:hypothetical protein
MHQVWFTGALWLFLALVAVLAANSALSEIVVGTLARRDRPVMVTIVDTEENLARLVPAVEEMMDTGLMAASEVRMIRVEKKATTHDGTGA